MIETGPPYPPPPAAGSNGIGQFQIGVSQIGDIAPFDWRQTVISQYANSDKLTGIIGSFFAAVDQTQNIERFYDLIWNIDTAQGYGLDVWGRIVGINRTIQVQSQQYFGFSEASPGAVGFDQGPFYGGENLTQNYHVQDDAYRTLILAKAMANISNGSIPSINAILMFLFQNRGNAYVAEIPPARYFGFSESGPAALGFNTGIFYAGQPIIRMAVQYVFNFPLTAIDLAIVNSGVIPKPAGVAASISVI